MKILVLASTFPRYANDTQPQFVLDFAKQIAKTHQVYVVAPHDKGAAYREQIENITVYRFPYAPPSLEKLAYRGGMVNVFKEHMFAKLLLLPFLVMEFLYSLYICKKHHIDILNPHWLFPQGFVVRYVKLLTKRKIVLVTHGGDVAILQTPKIARLLATTLRSADRLTFVTARNMAIADAATSGSIHQKSSVLPMGVRVEPLTTNNPSAQRIVGYIGRLVTIKGLDYLLKAFGGVLGEFPDAKLVIAGDGPQAVELKELAASLGISTSVDFAGFVDREAKQEFFSRVQTLVVPSIVDKNGYEEGLPVSALEAMAYGKILIATNTGGLPELVKSGTNGILVDHSDADKLADALKQSFKMTPQQISDMSHNAITTSLGYSWELVGKKFDGLLCEI